MGCYLSLRVFWEDPDFALGPLAWPQLLASCQELSGPQHAMPDNRKATYNVIFGINHVCSASIAAVHRQRIDVSTILYSTEQMITIMRWVWINNG